MEVLMRPALIGINTIRNVGLDLKIHLKELFHSIILAMHGLLFFRIVFEFGGHAIALVSSVDAGVGARGNEPICALDFKT